MAAGWAQAASGPDEFELLQQQIERFTEMRQWGPSNDATNLASWAGYHPSWAELERQTHRKEALILQSDRDPLDVVLRRTRALLENIRRMPAARDLSSEARQLDMVVSQAGADEAKRRALFAQVCLLRRQIAFANPLLNFDKLIFITRNFGPFNEWQGDHMVWQRYGRNAFPGGATGGLYVLENTFGTKPTVSNVLASANAVCANGRFAGRKLPPGGFLSPSLSYDGKTVVFAYTPKGDPENQTFFHLYKVNVDGTGLTQLTDGPFNDFDPCWLPSGRIAFISERRGGNGRCFEAGPVLSYNLTSMNADGSDITLLSYHETNEWSPAVDNNGMIVYTRWDYIDRGFNQAHHPWITTPDGRDARALHGNYRVSPRLGPFMEIDLRPIPGSSKLMATATGHHYQAYGSLVLIDPNLPDDNAVGPIKRLTPEALFPEAETPEKGGPQPYATAWPLSEDYWLCVYDAQASATKGPANHYGIYLVDAFGNRELLWQVPGISCLSPIPLRPRPTPPTITHATAVGVPRETKESASSTAEAAQTAPVSVINVYDSRHPWPRETVIKALRIYQLLPRPASAPLLNAPKIGYASGAGARAVLGTVPVEADGSAHFNVPTGKLLYFQALDANGLAVQSMRSGTYVHPGERLTCQGCHEERHRAPGLSGQPALALRRPPSEIRPEEEGSNPLSFPRLVQPVLDRHCVNCHGQNGDAPDLRAGDWRKSPFKWSTSYANLDRYAFFYDSGNRTGWNRFVAPETIPGQFGARASRLYKVLASGHYDVRLPANDMRCITLWLDSDSNFFGAYEQPEAQAQGEVVRARLE